jgi:phosphoesterase RecJ-like protein
MDDTENLVNFLLRIKGVRLAALCREIDGGVRVSLRARSPHSAHEIAVVFGGGGHDMAAGCTIHEPIAEALFLLRAEMDNHAAISDSPAE